MALELNRAVFLDRDGTLIEERHYLCDPAQVVVFPEAGPALRRLRDAGFQLIVVSNQSGVGRGYFTMADVERVNAKVAEEFNRHGVTFDHVFIAPEAPDEPSRGRKPSPGFLLESRQRFGTDLTQSYIIGDKLIDLECGWNAKVRRSLLVRTGYGTELERTAAGKLRDAVVVDGLPAAVEWILLDSEQRQPASAGAPVKS